MELEIIRYIQSFHNTFLDYFFEFITMFGEEVFLFGLLTFIYWNVDKSFGKYLSYSMLTSVNFNGVLKNIFNLPRPIGEEGIRTLREHTATGSSFPSGHSQGASNTFFSLAFWIRKKWVYWIAIIIPILVAISRLYLGVHYPKDVLAGFILGLAISYLCYFLFHKIQNKNLLFFITAIVMTPAWFIAYDSPDFVKAYALLVGLAFGNYIESKYVNFSVEGSKVDKAVRWFLGLIVVLLIKAGLKLIFPQLMIFDFIRYFLISFVGLGIYPMLFKYIHFKK